MSFSSLDKSFQPYVEYSLNEVDIIIPTILSSSAFIAIIIIYLLLIIRRIIHNNNQSNILHNSANNVAINQTKEYLSLLDNLNNHIAEKINLTNKLSSLQQEYNDLASARKEKNHVEKNDIKAQIIQLTKTNNSKNKEAEELESKCVRLEKELAAANKDHERKVIQLEEKAGNDKILIASLNAQIATTTVAREKSIDQFTAQKKELESKIESLNNELSEKEKFFAAANEQLKALDNDEHIHDLMNHTTQLLSAISEERLMSLEEFQSKEGSSTNNNEVKLAYIASLIKNTLRQRLQSHHSQLNQLLANSQQLSKQIAESVGERKESAKSPHKSSASTLFISPIKSSDNSEDSSLVPSTAVLTQLNNELSAAGRQLEGFVARSQHDQRKISDLELMLEELNSEKSLLLSQLQSSQLHNSDELNKTQSELSLAQSQLSISLEEKSRLEKEVDQVKLLNQELNDSIREKQIEFKRLLHAELQSLSAKHQQEIHEITEEKLKQANAELSTLRNIVTQLTAELGEEKERIVIIEEENKQFKQQLEQKSHEQQSVLNVELQQLRAKIRLDHSNYTAEISQLTTRVQAAQGELEELKRVRDEKTKMIQELEKSSSKQYKENQEKLTAVTEQLSKAHNEVAACNAKLFDLKRDFDELSSVYNEFKSNYQGELLKSQQSISEINASLKAVIEKLNQKNKELDELSQTLTQQGNELESTTKQLVAAKSEINALLAQVHTESNSSSQGKLLAEYPAAIELLKQAQLDITKAQQESSAQRSRITQLEQFNAQNQSALQDAVQSAENHIKARERAEKNLQEFTQQLKLHIQHISELEAANKEQNQTIKQLELTAAARNNPDIEKELSAHTASSTHHTIQQLQDDNQHKARLLENYQTQIEKLKLRNNDSAEMNSIRSNYEAEIQLLKLQLTNITNDYKEYKSRYSVNSRDSNLSTVDSLLEEIKEYRELMGGIESRNAELESRNAELIKKLAEK
jgi:hypothetical protein